MADMTDGAGLVSEELLRQLLDYDVGPGVNIPQQQPKKKKQKPIIIWNENI